MTQSLHHSHVPTLPTIPSWRTMHRSPRIDLSPSLSSNYPLREISAHLFWKLNFLSAVMIATQKARMNPNMIRTHQPTKELSKPSMSAAHKQQGRDRAPGLIRRLWSQWVTTTHTKFVVYSYRRRHVEQRRPRQEAQGHSSRCRAILECLLHRQGGKHRPQQREMLEKTALCTVGLSRTGT